MKDKQNKNQPSVKDTKQQPNQEALEKIDSKFPNHAERNRSSIDERGPAVKEGLDKKYDRNPNN